MKKLLAFVLSMIMVMALLAGCSSDKPKEAASTKEGTTKENSNKKEDTKKDTGKKEDTSKKHKVILITMDSIDQHWVNVDKGAQKAADELGAEYKWMAPDKKDDAQQIERVNNAVADGADAIVIAANGPDAITAALDEAKTAGIKIVYVDSPANTEACATFSTNNKAAGKTAGGVLLDELKAKGISEGKIGIVNVNPSTDSVVQREAGFREAFEGTNFEILETQYGEGDVAKSQEIADNYITQGIVGIFGTNEGGSVGVGNAIKGAGGGVVGVGFDKSDANVSLVKDGSLLAIMAQNPDVMGYEGVKAAIQAINGEEIPEKDVNTGVSVITKDALP
ncbi:MAG TPA: BMP family ABC transporter substrate-binding protein [Lachnospiraceae bacterium]|nr:BMP family ABC transporter substrate-binding protein [Lachnospiraceae bacterium]